jgi:CDP-glycerol glycerophosphotransferase (TagB/SpsB family)
MQKIKQNTIMLSPASPACMSLAEKLKSEGFHIVGFFDNKKRGKGIYKFEESKDVVFDTLLIYNELFFAPIYKQALHYFPKNSIYRVTKKDGKYTLLDAKEIQKDLLKIAFEKIKYKFYGKIQKFIAICFDRLPIQRKLHLFIAKDTINANIQYFYLFTKEKYKDENVILISNDTRVKLFSHRNIFFNSLKSYIYVALAKNIIVEEVFYEYFDNLTTQQNTIQLWHGLAIKKLFPVDNIYYNYYIATSDWANESHFKTIFQAQNFLNYGYPRNDIFLKKETEDELLLCDRDVYDLAKKENIIVYMPTYRDIDEQNIPPLDFNELDEFLERVEFKFIIKLHPFVNHINLKKKEYKNIIFYKGDNDIYPVLKYTDILITDYSSILYDFLLLDRPIIVFTYDFELYNNTRNGFVYNYEDLTPAEQVITQRELFDALNEIILKKNDKYRLKREEILKLTFDYTDAQSSKRISVLL